MAKNIVCIDTETHRFQPGNTLPRLVCVSYFDGTDGGVLDRTDGVALVSDILTHGGRLVGHNIAFDMGVLVVAGLDQNLVWQAYMDERILCTLIREKLRKIALDHHRINPCTGMEARYGLADCVLEYFGETLEGKKGEDVWRTRYHELDGVPISEYPTEAYEYAREDAVLGYRLYMAQVEAYPEIPDFERQCAYDWSLKLTTAWGLRTDPVAIDAVEKTLINAVGNASARLQQYGIFRADGTKDTKILKGIVNDAYQGAPPKTDKGNIKTDMLTLSESKDPRLILLSEISTEKTLLQTYIPLLRQGTQVPLNPAYALVETGRTSAFKPNIQNQPRYGGIRECFVPRDGHVYICADYHIAELCAFAQVLLDLFGKSTMAEALQHGRELHLETAASILKISYDDCVDRFNRGDEAVKQARQLAKAANFGYPGGLGAKTFIEYAKATYGLTITESQARSLKDAWMDRYPEIQLYFDFIAQQASNGGGRFLTVQHRSGRLRGGCTFTSGCNTRFQGLAADGAKRALFEVSQECYTNPTSPLAGSHPVWFIHDEIGMETPESANITAAAERLSEIMVSAMKSFTPDIPIRASAHAMRRWYKEAEPVYNEAGALIPWEPKK